MAAALSHRPFLSPCSSYLNRTSSSSLSPPYRPVIIAMAQQSPSFSDSINANIDTHLKKAIPLRPPLSVFEPMHYLTFSAPRTTAPALCVAACELVGGRLEDALDAASAIHLMHVAAFTHENLPLTDRPTTSPKINHAFGPNIELLTGDGIVPFGFELLAESQGDAGKVLRVIVEITRAVGSQGTVDGQYVESDGQESIEYVCEKKEGGLHACGAACGAILGGGSEEEIERLRKYGLYVGMIQGMLYGAGKNEGGKMKIIENLRVLALDELEYFHHSEKVEKISSFVETSL